MAVTIKDVAKAAGVCRATVDKVLHDRPGVSDKLREHVLYVINELEYEPSLIGQALKRGDSKIKIAAVLLDVQSCPYLRKGLEEKYASIQSFGIELKIIVTPYPDVKAQQKELEKLLKENTAGVILTPLEDRRIIQAVDNLEKAGIRVLTVNTDLNGSARSCYIGQNNFRAGRAAGQLISMLLDKKGSVAVLSASDLSRFNSERVRGFQEFLSESSDIYLTEKIDVNEQPAKMYSSVKILLENYPNLNALYITCGCVVDAVRAVKDSNTDLHIVCFDSFPENITLMEAGYIDFIIDQELSLQSSQALQILFNYFICNKELPKEPYYTSICIKIRENLSS